MRVGGMAAGWNPVRTSRRPERSWERTQHEPIATTARTFGVGVGEPGYGEPVRTLLLTAPTDLTCGHVGGHAAQSLASRLMQSRPGRVLLTGPAGTR